MAGFAIAAETIAVATGVELAAAPDTALLLAWPDDSAQRARVGTVVDSEAVEAVKVAGCSGSAAVAAMAVIAASGLADTAETAAVVVARAAQVADAEGAAEAGGLGEAAGQLGTAPMAEIVQAAALHVLGPAQLAGLGDVAASAAAQAPAQAGARRLQVGVSKPGSPVV